MRILICIMLMTLSLGLYGQVVRAADGATVKFGTDGETITFPNGLPPLLIKEMIVLERKFIIHLRDQFHSMAGTDHVLNENDILIARQRKEAEVRADRTQKLSRFDLDGDGTATRREIDLHLNSLTGRDRREAILSSRQLLTMDLNDDNKVTAAEVHKSSADALAKMDWITEEAERMKQFLALDPSGDNRLTAKELISVGRAAFDVFDKNDNGHISRAEIKEYWQQADRKNAVRDRGMNAKPARARSPKRKTASNCALPPAEGMNDVILVGSYESGVRSKVKFAGQGERAEIARLTIEPGATPLYVVAMSYEPMIWQVDGQVDRIARFVAVARGPRDAPTADVTGLPKEKVSVFPSRDCFKYFYDPDSEDARRAKAVVESQLGKSVKATVASYRLPEAALPSGKIKRPGRGKRR